MPMNPSDRALSASVGAKVRLARGRAKMTCRRLGEAAGVSHVSIVKIEQGEHCPSLTTFVRMADALGVTFDYLLGREVPY